MKKKKKKIWQNLLSIKRIDKMKITSHFILKKSDNDTVITYAGSENGKYLVFEDRIDNESKQIKHETTNIESGSPISLIDESGDKFIFLSGNKREKQKLFLSNNENLINTDVSFALINLDTIYYVKTGELDNHEASFIFSNQQSNWMAAYLCVIYKLILSNTKVAFLYYSHEEKETTYGIKIFKSFNELLKSEVYRDIKSPHVGKITDIAFTPNEKYLYSCGYDGFVNMWDLSSEDSKVKSIYASNSPVVSVNPNPINNFLFVAACTNGDIITKSTENYDSNPSIFHIEKNSGEFVPATYANFSPSDPLLIIASSNTSIKTFKLKNIFH